MSIRSAGNPLRLLSHLRRAQSHSASAFDYALPASRIALHPLPDRASSNLLVHAPPHAPHHLTFRDLPSLLPPAALLLLNVSRVIPSRIPMRKHPSHAPVELMLLRPVSLHHASAALAAPAHGQHWTAYIRGKRVRPRDTLITADGPALSAHVLTRHRQAATVRLELPPASAGTSSLAEALHAVGQTPLPPYLRREAEEGDVESYQTVYASSDGSVAAPTAGLHMTGDVLTEVRERGVSVEEVVLHVGAGTFAPVSAETVGGHDMHEEQICLEGRCVERVLTQVAEDKPIISMGTTSLRTLESMYWFGVRLLMEEGVEEGGVFHVGQWEPYERMDQLGVDALPPASEAIGALLDWHGGRDAPMFGTTRLLIVPQYPFKMVDALITNFHQPRSTLLMLVSAFLGGSPEDLFRVYEEALDRGYRFLSYGDSSIFARPSFFQRKRT